MNKELKPCPFCGKPARRKVRSRRHQSRFGTGCSNNECIIWLPDDVTLSDLHCYVSVYVKESDADEAWNARSESDKLMHALRIIAGKAQPLDNTMGNQEIALAVLNTL